MTHPRTAELVLDGFILDSEMKDAVLGDFAEEWTVREQRDGTRAAGRWYWTQAALSIPHLMLDWFRQARWLRVGGVVVAVVVIRLITMFGGAIAFIASAWLLHVLGTPGWTATILSSLASAGVAFIGGALVARLFLRAPMPAVLWLTVTVILTTVTLGGPPMANFTIAPWYEITAKVFSIPATVAGALFVLRRKRQKAPQV